MGYFTNLNWFAGFLSSTVSPWKQLYMIAKMLVVTAREKNILNLYRLEIPGWNSRKHWKSTRVSAFVRRKVNSMAAAIHCLQAALLEGSFCRVLGCWRHGALTDIAENEVQHRSTRQTKGISMDELCMFQKMIVTLNVMFCVGNVYSGVSSETPIDQPNVNQYCYTLGPFLNSFLFAKRHI